MYATEIVATDFTRPLQDLVHECWGLEAIAEDYRRFIELAIRTEVAASCSFTWLSGSFSTIGILPLETSARPGRSS